MAQTQDEFLIELTPGFAGVQLRFPAAPLDCSYVRLEAHGCEVQRWKAGQWAKAPGRTMGEIVAAIHANLPPAQIKPSAAYLNECIFQLREHVELLCEMDGQNCLSIRVQVSGSNEGLIAIDPQEVGLWVQEKWQGAPAEVMGAFLGLLGQHCPHFSPDDEPAPSTKLNEKSPMQKSTHQALASMVSLLERLQNNVSDGQALQAILRQGATGAAYEAARAALTADSTCKIAVSIEEGHHVQIVSDRPVQAVVVDFDIDGCSESRPKGELKFIASSNAQAYVSPMDVPQDANECMALFAHISATAVGDSVAFADGHFEHTAAFQPAAAALDESALGTWFEEQIMSGKIELGSIPALLARYALAPPSKIRMELATLQQVEAETERDVLAAPRG